PPPPLPTLLPYTTLFRSGVDGAGRASRPVRERGCVLFCRHRGRVHSRTGRDLSVTARARGGAPRSDAGGAVVVLAHEALELLLAAVPARGVAGEGPRIGVLPQLPAPPAPRQGRGGVLLVGGQEEGRVHRGPVPHHVVPPVQVRVQHGAAPR